MFWSLALVILALVVIIYFVSKRGSENYYIGPRGRFRREFGWYGGGYGYRRPINLPYVPTVIIPTIEESPYNYYTPVNTYYSDGQVKSCGTCTDCEECPGCPLCKKSDEKPGAKLATK